MIKIARNLTRAAVLVVAFVSLGALATGFSASPVSFEFEPKDRADVITIVSNTAQQKAFELVILRWKQLDGTDIYEPTDDFFVTPPSFQLGPNEARTVRLLRAQIADESDEITYRLFVREIPLWQNHIKGQMNLSIELSIPVFMKAAKPSPSALNVQISTANEGTRKRLTLSNTGRTHGKVIQAQPLLRGEPTGKPLGINGYALPGNSKSWEINSDQLEAADGLLVTLSNGMSKTLPLSK